jgi:hypothetical protein
MRPVPYRTHGIECRWKRGTRFRRVALYWRRRQAMAVDVEAARGLFAVEEYHRMAEAGIPGADERVELIATAA